MPTGRVIHPFLMFLKTKKNVKLNKNVVFIFNLHTFIQIASFFVGVPAQKINVFSFFFIKTKIYYIHVAKADLRIFKRRLNISRGLLHPSNLYIPMKFIPLFIFFIYFLCFSKHRYTQINAKVQQAATCIRSCRI